MSAPLLIFLGATVGSIVTVIGMSALAMFNRGLDHCIDNIFNDSPTP